MYCIVQFIYTGQSNVEPLKLKHFLSVGKDLRVTRVLEQSDPNEVQNLREYIVTEGNEFQRSNTIDTSFEETNKATREIVTEKNKRINTDGSKQGNAEFVCNDCDAVYKSTYTGCT